MLGTKVPQVCICCVLSSSEGKRSLLVVSWVRYSDNKANRQNQNSFEGREVWFAVWLEDAVGSLSQIPSVFHALLGWWNEGYSLYIAQNIQGQPASTGEDRVIIQHDWLHSKIWKGEINCKILFSCITVPGQNGLHTMGTNGWVAQTAKMENVLPGINQGLCFK